MSANGVHETYEQLLERLADASVERGFSPYKDIDWDAPEFQVKPNDDRWILPEIDPLGRHPWYLAQPREKQIAIGMYRQAQVAKVGLQFEQLLMAGFMEILLKLPNRSAEARYITHEVIEECNHTLMFQRAVDSTGADARGFGPIFRRLAPVVPLLAWPSNSLFLMAVLAGEEPIDHIQKSYLRTNGDFHPIIKGVMRIHVAEEARHISFAHEYLRNHVPEINFAGRAFLSVAFPIALRIAGQLIVPPPPVFWEKFDIPDSVRKDLFWRSEDSKKTLAGYYSDVRMLAEEIGLMNPVSKRVWQVLGIAGRPSRYRSEPERAPKAA